MTFDKKLRNSKTCGSIDMKLSGIMRVRMHNICENFCWKRPSTQKVAAWYATSDCSVLA